MSVFLLGLCSYYCRFTLQFSSVAKPLTKLTEKVQEFRWGSEQAEAWAELKQRLLQAPIFIPNSKSSILDTDAGAFGIGAVLSQVKNGKERVTASENKCLSKEERHYCVA